MVRDRYWRAGLEARVEPFLFDMDRQMIDADIVVSSRKEDACEKTAAEVRELGRHALSHPCHVGRWEECEQLVTAAYGISGLYNLKPLTETSSGMMVTAIAGCMWVASVVMTRKIMDLQI